jgi:hypothetical protein
MQDPTEKNIRKSLILVLHTLAMQLSYFLENELKHFIAR